MWYTVWKQVNIDTYKFYMAAETSTAAVSAAPEGAIITETEFSFNANYKTADELSQYDKLPWFSPGGSQ